MMNRWNVGLPVASLAGVATFLLSPSDWVLPAFGIGVAVLLFSAIAARMETKPRQAIDPAVELALAVVNLPPDPLAKVAVGWALWSFAVSTTYVASLFVAIVWAAQV